MRWCPLALCARPSLLPQLPYQELEVWMEHPEGAQPMLAGVLQMGARPLHYPIRAPVVAVATTVQKAFLFEMPQRHSDEATKCSC